MLLLWESRLNRITAGIRTGLSVIEDRLRCMNAGMGVGELEGGWEGGGGRCKEAVSLR